MKKSVKLFAVAALAVMAFSGCKKNTEGKFVLGLDAAFPPLGFTDDDGKITGYDIDLAKEVSSRLNLDFVAKPIDWAAKDAELAVGAIDCIWNGFTITEQRQKEMAFTPAYLDNAQVLVIRNADKAKFSKITDFAGKVIGCQKESSAEEAINDNAEFHSSLKSVKTYEDNLTALTDLEVCGVDAIVMDLVVAEYQIYKSGKDFVILEDNLGSESYGIGFKKDEKGTALRDKVWKTLLDMELDGTVKKISEKWFGSDKSVISR